MYQHFVKNNVRAPQQYGFRNRLSTELASFKLLEAVITSLNNKSTVGSIFCNIRKAFDVVNHTILMSKMEFYGIKGKAYQLLKSYLNDRYQRVLIRKNSVTTFSDWEMVCSGAPQGSILGPLLCLIYINDLPFILKDTGAPTLFADDTSIIYSHSNLNKFIKEINLSFRALNTWLANNKLPLNYNKTHFMQLYCKPNNNITLPINYNNNHISKTQSIKFLGLIHDSNIT